MEKQESLKIVSFNEIKMVELNLTDSIVYQPSKNITSNSCNIEKFTEEPFIPITLRKYNLYKLAQAV